MASDLGGDQGLVNPLEAESPAEQRNRALLDAIPDNILRYARDVTEKRLMALAGRLSLESFLGEGTVVRARLPVRPRR